MKYQNKTPEEIVKHYLRGLRIKQAVILLIYLLYLVSIFYNIWSLNSGFSTGCLALLLLVALTLPISVWASWDFMSLNQILNQNCDPVTYTAVCRLLLNTRQRRQNRLTTAVNEAIGVQWCGRFSEALDLLDRLTIPEKRVSLQLLARNVRFNCVVNLGDLESARRIRAETERYTKTIRRPAMQKPGAELLRIMDGGLALREGDYETFRRLEETLSIRSRIQKVASAYHLAQADLAQGEEENARARLTLAAEQGGTLFIAERARQLLAELDGEE